MRAVRWRCVQVLQAAGAFLLLIAASVGVSSAEEVPGIDDWHPESSYAGKFDWVQMTSGEWIKGRLVVLYDGDLEFNSDEFGRMIIDWQNVRQLRTSQVVSVGLSGSRSFVGKLVLTGSQATVHGAEVEHLDKTAVLTITAGAPRERNYWTMEVFAGAVVRGGNTEVREINLQGVFQRRTIRNRFLLDLVLNENTTEDEQVSSNQRVSVNWSRFVNQRLFVTPLAAEYFRDPFQNLQGRYTIGAAVGYQLMDSSKTDWTIAAGPGYQETSFESVAAFEDDKASTPVVIFSTRVDRRITRWLKFDGLYRMQLVNKASGTYNHHMLLSLESRITKLLSFDASWIWDRIRDPRPDASGETPKQDDYRTTVGLSFEF